MFEVLSDLRGRTVLDLACGEGVYTRQFKRAGATAVTGVDISQATIALAEGEERQDPLGCRYVRADAAAFTPAAPVDIVTAVYLLNYAPHPGGVGPLLPRRLLPHATAGWPARRVQRQRPPPAGCTRLGRFLAPLRDRPAAGAPALHAWRVSRYNSRRPCRMTSAT